MKTAPASLLVLLLASCAAMEPEGHPLLSFLDEAVQPSSTAGRVALAAPALAAGATALAVDAAMVNPMRAVSPAWSDTLDALWGPVDGSPFKQSLLFGPKLAWTPAHLAGRWWWRGMMLGGFDSSPFETRDAFLEEEPS